MASRRPDVITHLPGGHGAVREICDRAARGTGSLTIMREQVTDAHPGAEAYFVPLTSLSALTALTACDAMTRHAACALHRTAREGERRRVFCC